MTIRERLAALRDNPKRIMQICGWIGLALMLSSGLLKDAGIQVLGDFVWWVALGLIMAAAIGAMARKQK